MWMLVACVNFQFFEHGATQRASWQHALHSQLDGTLRGAINKLFKSDFLQPAWKITVAVVNLVFAFRTCNADFLGVHYNNVVASIAVRGKFWLVLATQTDSKLCCQTSQYQVFCVYDIPVVMRCLRVGADRSHFFAALDR